LPDSWLGHPIFFLWEIGRITAMGSLSSSCQIRWARTEEFP
jgi:hypothetical protein